VVAHIKRLCYKNRGAIRPKMKRLKTSNHKKFASRFLLWEPIKTPLFAAFS